MFKKITILFSILGIVLAVVIIGQVVLAKISIDMEGEDVNVGGGRISQLGTAQNLGDAISLAYLIDALNALGGDPTPDTIADDGWIQETEIVQNSLDDSEIEDDSLTALSLAPNSVGASEIAAGAVGTSEVADNSLTAADLAPNSVGNSELIDAPTVTGLTLGGVYRTTWPTGGDNLGNHTATLNLNMNDFEVQNVKALQGKDWDDNTGGADTKYRLLFRDGAHMFYNGGVVVGGYGNNTWTDVPDGRLIVKERIGVNRTPIYPLDVQGNIRAVSGWFRSTDDYGLYNETDGTYFYSDDVNYLLSRSDRGLRIANRAGATKGYLYHNNSNGFGLLDADGNWVFRSERDSYNAFYVNNSEKMRITSAGNLQIQGGISTYDTTVSDNTVETGQLCLGNGTNCRTTWPTGGDNLGNHTATQNLNMSGYQIQNMRIENRTSDPSSPAVGQIWIRTDL